MSGSQPAFTFGIEEEYHLVDLTTRDAAPAPETMMAALEAALGSQVSPEFLRSQIEVGTRPANSFKAAREELAGLRRTIADAARAHGLAPIAAATHPFAVSTRLQTTEGDRYRTIARDLAGVSWRMAICGMHVHVSIEGDDLRIDIMNQVRYFLPHLLMLSTSSPFWEGQDTGLKSFRLAVNQECPRSGLPGYLHSWAEYESMIDVLVQAGVIEDATKIWWDVRPSASLSDPGSAHRRRLSAHRRRGCDCGALRLGGADADAVAPSQSIMADLSADAARKRTAGARSATGPAARCSISARGRCPRAGTDRGTVALVAEDAQALGCEAEIARVGRIVEEGTSADRQIATFKASLDKGLTKEDALCAVVDELIAETVSDL